MQKLFDLVAKVYNSTIASDIVDLSEKKDDNFNDFPVKFVSLDECKIGIHRMNDYELRLIRKSFPKSCFYDRAYCYSDKSGNVYVDDGAILAGKIYKIDINKNVSIYARK